MNESVLSIKKIKNEKTTSYFAESQWFEQIE